MTTVENSPPLHLPARDIPVPVSVSPEARAVLAMPRPEPTPFPALEDVAGWKALIAAGNGGLAAMAASWPVDPALTVEQADVDGVTVYVATPPGARDDHVYLDFHGGGMTVGGGPVCGPMSTRTATRVAARVWAVDYRMPPEHPYPAALDDGLTAYRALLKEHRPEQIIIGGGSAGANLAAAVLLRARDEGLPLPAAAVLNTPELDLTESGDTFQTNAGLCAVLPGSLMAANLLYARGHDLADPYLSPLFGDFSKGFPPTLLTSGTRDLFLSNAVRMHRALRNAGITAELHVMEAAGHGGFLGYAPEDAEIDRDVRRFLDTYWAA